MKKILSLIFTLAIGLCYSQDIYTETVKYTVGTATSNEEDTLLSYSLPENSSGYINLLVVAKDSNNRIIFFKKHIVFEDSTQLASENTVDSIISSPNAGAEVSTTIIDNVFYVPIVAPTSDKIIVWQAVIDVYINDTLIIPPIYDPAAIALFDSVGDVPDIVKPYFNDLIVAFKDAGVWDNEDFWAILCVPSRNAFNTLIEIKSLQIVSSFYGSSAPTAPYNTAQAAIPNNIGYSFSGAGYIRTGFVPSSSQTLNNSSEFIVLYSDETGVSSFNYGSFTSTSASSAFSIKLNTAAMVADAYSTTVGSGRVSVSSASGAKGVYIKNRQSSSYMSIVQNGTVIGYITGNSGSLSSYETYLNCYNNAGTASTRRNQSPICAWGSFGSGLTSQQETDLSTALADWQTGLQRISGAETQQIVLDGNSHTVYWFAQMYRTIQYNTILSEWKYINFGVSGQTTAQMLSDYSSQVAPVYNSSYSRNIYIPVEVTNDLYSGATLDQAKDNYHDLCSTAQVTGWEVYAVPIMCRNYSGNTGRTQTQFNLVVDDFNEWLVSNYTSFADTLVPVNAATFIWRSNYASDGAYNTAVSSLIAASPFYDQVHLTDPGYIDWGTQITTTISQ